MSARHPAVSRSSQAGPSLARRRRNENPVDTFRLARDRPRYIIANYIVFPAR